MSVFTIKHVMLAALFETRSSWWGTPVTWEAGKLGWMMREQKR